MGYKVREVRLEKGMTQEKLASISGVSRGTIHSLETDPDYSTNTKTLLKIAEALETTVDNIFFVNTV